jgi:hypothetical protein
MTAFSIADMRACIEERGGLLMPEESLALIELAEAAEDNAKNHNPVSHRLGRSLSRFDFGDAA